MNLGTAKLLVGVNTAAVLLGESLASKHVVHTALFAYWSSKDPMQLEVTDMNALLAIC